MEMGRQGLAVLSPSNWGAGVCGVRFHFKGGGRDVLAYKLKTHPTHPSTPLSNISYYHICNSQTNSYYENSGSDIHLRSVS